MAEMLVRTVDKVNEECPYLSARCLKRGDVVVICPDDWHWTKAERTASYWVIIRVRGASVEELRAFLDEEPGDQKVNRMLQRRAHRLDLEMLGKKVELKLHEAHACRRRKPSLPDPNVL